jgi:hypothetical protein
MGIYRFFDRLEDKIRGWFSHYPLLYGFYGGIGLVLFWRGVWHTADAIALWYWSANGTMDITPSMWDGPVTFVIGSIILLSCGLLVSEFIGNEIIISGLRGEKKLTEKTEGEVRTDTGALALALEKLDSIEKRIANIEKRK